MRTEGEICRQNNTHTPREGTGRIDEKNCVCVCVCVRGGGGGGGGICYVQGEVFGSQLVRRKQRRGGGVHPLSRLSQDEPCCVSDTLCVLVGVSGQVVPESKVWAEDHSRPYTCEELWRGESGG